MNASDAGPSHAAAMNRASPASFVTRMAMYCTSSGRRRAIARSRPPSPYASSMTRLFFDVPRVPCVTSSCSVSDGGQTPKTAHVSVNVPRRTLFHALGMSARCTCAQSRLLMASTSAGVRDSVHGCACCACEPWAPPSAEEDAPAASSHAATEGSRHSSVCASSAPIGVREEERPSLLTIDD